MMTRLESRRLVIAGASSLLGRELNTLLEESRFAACDFRLVDEESVSGRLIEAGGEPAVIQAAEADSFNKATAVFFTGSAPFTQANLQLAQDSGARVIDLSGALAGNVAAKYWTPGSEDRASLKSTFTFAVPSAHAEIIARLTTALSALQISSMTAVAFQPVSIGGSAGIEELESQTGQLLSFQPPGKAVFDVQVAFNLLDRFGSSSQHKMTESLQGLRSEVRACLPPSVPMPAVQLLHAPVFYGATVTACTRIKSAADAARVTDACAAAGFHITVADAPPSNLSVAGENALQLAPPIPDAEVPGAWWLWAAADNLRRPASNAVKLAETLLA